jgi:hypothetical protein
MLLLREGQRAPQTAREAVADNESAREPQLPACGEANRTACGGNFKPGWQGGMQSTQTVYVTGLRVRKMGCEGPFLAGLGGADGIAARCWG